MDKLAEIEKIKEKFAENFIRIEEFRDQITVVVDSSAVYDVLEFLKKDREFLYEYLVDTAGVDYLHLEEVERFGIVYLLYSYLTNRRIRVKTFVPEDKLQVKTITTLWKSADWMEREIYDMFGIKFEGHPDLRRILNADYFKYHPLRKDYPLQGRGEREDFPVVK
jgi:NADH-quinone oxidoreductase subunit C